MTPALALEDISCTFVSRNDPSQRYTAVGGTTFVVGEGEFVSVVGPTGCGKTTLLNVAAGLLQPSSDTVVVLSAGPASHPIGDYAIDLPRPRDVAEIRLTPRFIEIHTKIWRAMKEEVLKGYARQQRR